MAVTANRWAALYLADFTAPVGPDTYLEVLAPTTPDHPVARWLDKVGGSSGWVREHGTGQQGMLCHTMINFI